MFGKDGLNVVSLASWRLWPLKLVPWVAKHIWAARPSRSLEGSGLRTYYLLVQIADIPLLAAITLTQVCLDTECSDHSE